MKKRYHIFSDYSGNDAIAVRFREDYALASPVGRKRLTKDRYQNGTRYRYTGFSYVASSRQAALGMHYDR